jgi:hypothetical protein
VLAIFISCLGLFGLASFVAEQHKRNWRQEGAGALVLNLWGMLSKDFVMLVIISCLTSIPSRGTSSKNGGINRISNQYQLVDTCRCCGRCVSDYPAYRKFSGHQGGPGKSCEKFKKRIKVQSSEKLNEST